eukprot:6295051-Pyramimonas_sp.AAC.1
MVHHHHVEDVKMTDVLRIDGLDNSVLMRIFALLSITDLIKVGMVCGDWHQLVSKNEAEWKRLFKKRWNVERGSPRALGSSSWKGAYGIWHQDFK